jgi:hypothetical protein
MSDHFKRMWKHYLALLVIVALVFLSISWIYKIVHYLLGREAALLSLTLTVMAALILGVRGAVRTHEICRGIHKQVHTLEFAENNIEEHKPVVLRVLNIDLPSPQQPCPDPVVSKENEESLYAELISVPRKRRGKQSRFSEDRIWKAVLKWEKRDTFFETRTLEEFLEQEFGCGPDGILQVAPSTFYDWRRSVLKEIEEHQNHPPSCHEKIPSKSYTSVPNSKE